MVAEFWNNLIQIYYFKFSFITTRLSENPEHVQHQYCACVWGRDRRERLPYQSFHPAI